MALLNGDYKATPGFPLLIMAVEALKTNLGLDLRRRTWAKAVEA